MLRIGSYTISTPIGLAPMTGITDSAFRRVCEEMGANYFISEMTSAQASLRHSNKSQSRTKLNTSLAPTAVQLVGSTPEEFADSARYYVEQGAKIIDINMGCPVKKVCNNFAGSALLKDELLVSRILKATVDAVDVPVTLKYRTGWDKTHINAITIAKMAQDCGIALLTLHGRTRTDGYTTLAEYDTIAEVKSCVSIPILANGDIDSPQKAKAVLDYTNADGIMIGRAAQGRPWIFKEIKYFLENNKLFPVLSLQTIHTIMLNHLKAHYQLYGDELGARSAKKHILWYSQYLPHSTDLCEQIKSTNDSYMQLKCIQNYFANHRDYPLTRGK